METAETADWQEKLAADRNSSALKVLLGKLTSMREKLRRFMDAGCPPEEYAVAEKLLAAVEAAESAATAYWERHNK
ncbi:MAG: hypothetical protein LBQ63_06240 [Deltaproteobacteria bacterium]|jgi:hypothetical protein|nr:hypothetical protein [Deltaproteobacteria bacterium]